MNRLTQLMVESLLLKRSILYIGRSVLFRSCHTYTKSSCIRKKSCQYGKVAFSFFVLIKLPYFKL